MHIYSAGMRSSKSVDQGESKAELCGYFSSEGTEGSCDSNPQVPPALQRGNSPLSVSRKLWGPQTAGRKILIRHEKKLFTTFFIF